MATLNLFLHAPSAGIVSERHFPIDESLERLQGRVEQITGIPPDAQRLSLLSTRDDDPDTRATLITALDGRVENLRQAGVQTAMCIRVDDSRPAALSKQYTDDSQVEKYEMDDETYAKRSDTVLAYKQRAKLGRFDPNSTVAADRSTTATAEQMTLPPDLKPGARCLVSLDGSSSALEGRRGTVRFVGPTEFAASGVWVGVEYDEPVGKNDGSVAGHRYFRCAPLRGGFVRPAKVVVGNYPEESIDSDEEM